MGHNTPRPRPMRGYNCERLHSRLEYHLPAEV